MAKDDKVLGKWMATSIVNANGKSTSVKRFTMGFEITKKGSGVTDKIKFENPTQDSDMASICSQLMQRKYLKITKKCKWCKTEIEGRLNHCKKCRERIKNKQCLTCGIKTDDEHNICEKCFENESLKLSGVNPESPKKIGDYNDNLTPEQREQKRIEFMYPETAKDALDRFEKGENLSVVELSGIGPGHEQSIWIGIFRMIKAYHTEDMDTWIKGEPSTKYPGRTTTDEKLLDVASDLNLSGAQAEAVKQTAWQLMKYGWRTQMLKAPKDRLIQICKNMPKYEV
jgi:hypothetical protein